LSGGFDPVEQVRALYAAMSRGDGAFLLEALAEDVEWCEPPGGAPPFGGTCRGRAAVGRFFEVLGATVEEEAFAVRDIVGKDDLVVALGSYRHRVKASGRSYGTDWVMVWRFAGEKVARFEIYKDSATEAAALTATRSEAAAPAERPRATSPG
jgi:ketosteroid isomerase-like protein